MQTEVREAGNGHVAHAICLRHLMESHHPFVVHMATWRDGMWCYSNGDYYTHLEPAITQLKQRASRNSLDIVAPA